MKKKNQDSDMEEMQKTLKKLIERNYKPKLSNQIRWIVEGVFEDLAMFSFICIYLLFRPINLLIGGLIAIIILLII